MAQHAATTEPIRTDGTRTGVADTEYIPTADLRSDEALVTACAGGDPGALGELYARHRCIMRATAARVLFDHHDTADDAVQETLARLPEQAARFRPGGPPVRAWLSSLAHYTALRLRDPHRAHRREAAPTHAVELTEALLSVLAAPDPADRAQTVAAREAERDQAGVLMAGLSARLRAAVELVYLQGMTREQAATELGITFQAIRSRLRAARAQMRTAAGHAGQQGAGEQGAEQPTA